MSVWNEIDELKRKHEAEFTATKNGIEGERGISNSLGIDDYGQWCCRFIRRGERKQERLAAKSGPALVAALKAIRAKEDEKTRPLAAAR